MNIHAIYTNEEIGALAKQRFQEERSLQRLDGWFLVKEIRRECDGKFGDLAPALKSANCAPVPQPISSTLWNPRSRHRAVMRSRARASARPVTASYQGATHA